MAIAMVVPLRAYDGAAGFTLSQGQ
jgi:hypothetical protein